MTQYTTLAIVFFLLLFGVGGFYVFKTMGDQHVVAMATSEGSLAGSDDASSTPPALSQSAPAITETAVGTRLYQNAAFHFGLSFPDALTATEYKEQGGALTVSFQDPNTNKGFEVYVTPYAKTQIDQARFKLDEPSGVYQQPTDIVVGDTHATMFYGRNAIMGDTREVWFIRGGYLYEVATYKELDTWLGGIMQSWHFLN